MKIVVTAADCRRETFRCGGKGGQNVNKRDTGVRFTHEPSGAVGESREERSQAQNEKTAWRRMAQHWRFQLWSRLRLMEEELNAGITPPELEVEYTAACRPGETCCDRKGPIG